ncbi:hypothetical protein CICLE_v10033288mg [Citrus x clementina]|uniref:Uncharacterized protein n=1 Tax=Citrus clementina TaxID=85681 RepID=V4VBJ2_CITCL|nr:hypothetical protein CICLE_v10033288mg [Citrus x clementina]
MAPITTLFFLLSSLCFLTSSPWVLTLHIFASDDSLMFSPLGFSFANPDVAFI